VPFCSKSHLSNLTTKIKGISNMVQIRNQHLLSIALISLFVATFSFRATRTVADDELQIAKHESTSKLVGTWKLEKAENPGSPSGIGTRLKMFNGTHWCVIQPDGAGKIVFLHGGTYDFDGSQLKTKTDFAGELTQTFVGTSGTVKLEIDGDVLNQIDPKGVFNETWRRVMKTDAK